MPDVELRQCVRTLQRRWRPFDFVGAFNAFGILQGIVGTSTTGMGFDVPQDASDQTTTIQAGDTWRWLQPVPRHPRAGTGHSNLSNGVSYTF
ncbi:MAG: hypothetical protein R3F17_15045 [Planctomycetota bacterium]